MYIEKKIVWSFRNGFHKARIVDARLVKECVNGKEEDMVRILLEITTLVHPTRRYMARKFYKRSESRLLIDDLEHLLGNDIQQVINLSGEIIPEGLMILVDKSVDVEIVHHHDRRYDQPYCIVEQIRSPGVLIEELRDAA